MRTSKKSLPASYRAQMGKLMVNRGYDPDGLMNLYSWDVVTDCRGEACSCHDKCITVNVGGKCRVQWHYISAAAEVIYRNYRTQLGEAGLFKVGMHLLPLYRILCIMKMEELSLSSPVNRTKGGFRVADPVYKEIRETIKLICGLWKSMGLGMTDAEDGLPDVEKLMRGGGNYYEQMEAEALKENDAGAAGRDNARISKLAAIRKLAGRGPGRPRESR
jgi:hypothetical protein